MNRLYILGALSLLLGGSLVGCSNTAEGVSKDTEQNGRAVEQGTAKAAEATSNATKEVVDATKDATKEVTEATKDATKDASAALVLTPKIKTAILADPAMADTKNKVNVDSADNVVHLKGQVVSETVKKHLGQVAQNVLTEGKSTDKLSNELEVINM